MLFDTKTETTLTINGVKLLIKMTQKVGAIHINLMRKNIVVGTIEVITSNRGSGKIVRLVCDKEYRKDSFEFIKEATLLVDSIGIKLSVSINNLLRKDMVEKQRRRLFILLSKKFKRAGFVFKSTYSMEYEKKAAATTKISAEVLTKPIKSLTYKDIKKPKHFWQALDEQELEEYKHRCFRVFRREGFPYVSQSRAARESWLNALRRTDINLVDLKTQQVKQNLTGLSLAWSFHPHAWSVPCGKGFMTVLDAFNDDEKLKLLVKRLIDYYPVMSKTNLFGRIKMLSGVQAVSNFRPSAAAAIYEHFGGGVVQDMSGGWGGRMLGAFRAPNVTQYIATEPSSKTYRGLMEQAQFLSEKKSLFNQTGFEVHKLGSEVFRPDKNSIDFAFTSPPYFNCERYSDEKTQSYVKFDTYDSWADGFLGGTFDNVRYGLKPGAFMAINIANVKGADGIEEDTLRVAKEHGFKFSKMMYLTLSKAGSGHKLEPIFVFQKPHIKRNA